MFRRRADEFAPVALPRTCVPARSNRNGRPLATSDMLQLFRKKRAQRCTVEPDERLVHAGCLSSPEGRHAGLAGFRSRSRGGHDLGECRSDLGILAFRETVANTWIKPVAFRQPAKRTVPRVIVHRRQRRKIPAMAKAASRESENRFLRRPGP